MGIAVDQELERVMMAADEIGIRLEIVAGVPYWEMQPGYRHQQVARRIADSLSRGKSNHDCACVSALDVGIRFHDGSVKRPDVSIFCREPDEQDGLVTLIPEAVVEVVSPGYEAKDFEIGPSFYLSQGVRDVVVHDPRSGRTVHFRSSQTNEIILPAQIEFLCGCAVEISR